MPPSPKAKVKRSGLPLPCKIKIQIEALRELRRELCCYAPPHSDKMCDCKYLEAAESTRGNYKKAESPDSVKPRSRNGMGEDTGCCEVRGAISLLEVVLASFKDPETLPSGKRKGAYGNCADCEAPFEHPSAMHPWTPKAPNGLIVDVCGTCNQKRLKEYQLRRVQKIH